MNKNIFPHLEVFNLIEALQWNLDNLHKSGNGINTDSLKNAQFQTSEQFQFKLYWVSYSMHICQSRLDLMAKYISRSSRMAYGCF